MSGEWLGMRCCTHTHTHTHTRLTAPFPGLPRWAGTRKVKLIWILLKQETVSEWQWHELGHIQVCTSLQTDNHASTPPLSFLQAGCSSCRPTNSVKAPKARCCTLKKLLQLSSWQFGKFIFNVSRLVEMDEWTVTFEYYNGATVRIFEIPNTLLATVRWSGPAYRINVALELCL